MPGLGAVQVFIPGTLSWMSTTVMVSGCCSGRLLYGSVVNTGEDFGFPSAWFLVLLAYLRMSDTSNTRVILVQMSPGSTRSVSGIQGPWQPDQKWAIGTRHKPRYAFFPFPL